MKKQVNKLALSKVMIQNLGNENEVKGGITPMNPSNGPAPEPQRQPPVFVPPTTRERGCQYL